MAQHPYLITLAILLLIVGFIILVGLPLFKWLGGKEPEVERRWADPAFREESRKGK